MAEGTQSRDQDAQRQHQPQLPPHAEDHGHSLAAWVGVGICMVGALVASLAVVFTIWWMLAAGLVVALTGPLAGHVLARMGHGAGSPQQSSDDPGDAPHDGPTRRAGEATSTTPHGPR